MLFFLLHQISSAEPFIQNISEEIDLQIGATWSIPFHDGYQWWLAMGQRGDLMVAPMFEGSWVVDMAQVQNLSNMTGLNDHSFRECSDGTYLHVTGGNIGGPNHIFRYDWDFSLISQGVFEQGQPPHANNDAPAICGDTFDGFGVAEQNGMRDFFNDVDNSSQITEQIEIPNSPRMTGAGLMEWEEKLIVIGEDPNLTLSVYDTNFDEIERHIIPKSSEEIRHYWPSRIERVGNYFLVATMGRDESVGFGQDTGDLYLLILDQNFQRKEWIQLSTNEPDNGGMRPWFDIHEDQLVIGYDKVTDLYLYTATLNLDAFNDEETTVPQQDEPSECRESDQADHCADGQDNDGDGYVDCDDQDCWGQIECPTANENPAVEESGCRSKTSLMFPLFLVPWSLSRKRTKKLKRLRCKVD